MSDLYAASRLADLMLQGFAANARIEGMKAENQWRAVQEKSPAYDEAPFSREAETLEYLAKTAREIGETR
jgi:hypothetical protein